MTQRVILGQLGDGSYGLRISKPGFDALTTSAENIMIDTGSGLSRVLQAGTLTFPAGGAMSQSAALASIGGFAPYVQVRTLYIEDGVTYAFPLWSTTSTAGTVNGWSAASDAGQVLVTRHFSESVTTYVAYFALAQRGNA